MKKIFNLISLLTLIMGLYCQTAKAQEINMIDEQNYYEIQENSDGSMTLVVTIDGMRKTADFDQASGIVPRYIGKYKSSLVFVETMDKTHRNVMVFRPIDGYVWQTTYENELCKIMEREECVIFYGDTPVKVEYNRIGSPKTKFSKLDSKYAKLKGHTISSCGGDFQIVED